MRANSLRRKLNSGQITVGTRLYVCDPTLVEIAGQTGHYDYVEFVGEYGSFHMHDLDNFCRAAELHGMGSMFKIDQSHQWFLAQRGIGAGFESVLFTDCRSADDVRACLRVARPDTPEDGGLYGAAVRRNALTGVGSPEYLQAIRDVVVAIMIEKQPTLENLEEILAVPGVDLVQWGGTDFAMSSGYGSAGYGRSTHPEVAAARDKVFERALALGVAPRAEISHPDEAQAYLDLGVRHFSLGGDHGVLRQFWNDAGAKLRELIGATG
jgi:4-hydroxy-2-oxoheptanedioate aldolase